MNIFEQLSMSSGAAAPAARSPSSLLNATSATARSSSLANFGLPLPDLFSHPACLDMPLSLDGLAGQELVLEEAGDASQPVVYEEVIDFFVDAADPSKVLISRSGAPQGAVAPMPLPAQAASIPPSAPRNPSHVASPSASNDSLLKRKRLESPVLAPAGEHKLAIKRERNRQAAERCRARRVNLIVSLQAECEQLRTERERLVKENRALMEALSAAGMIPSLQL